jgi:hypothetical protein
MTVVHLRRLRKKLSSVRCGMLLPVLLAVIMILSVCSSGAHGFHSSSKRTPSRLQPWTRGTGASCFSLSVRGGSFARPNTEVTVVESSTQRSVDYCDGTGGYVVSMCTHVALTRGGSGGRPFASSTSLRATSARPSEPSHDDDADLSWGFRKLFGEWSVFLLIVPRASHNIKAAGLESR